MVKSVDNSITESTLRMMMRMHDRTVKIFVSICWYQMCREIEKKMDPTGECIAEREEYA